jgi:two-component system cell cycle response regulator
MLQASRPKSHTAPRILLVDDNKSGLAARLSVLQEQGHCVTTATNGEDALERLGQNQFDLLVTDYRMPRMDGIELIRRVRTLHPGLPVILLSGYVEAVGLSESSTGADLVLTKSANEVTHLIRSVARLLRRKPARKPPTHVQPAARTRKVSG